MDSMVEASCRVGVGDERWVGARGVCECPPGRGRNRRSRWLRREWMTSQSAVAACSELSRDAGCPEAKCSHLFADAVVRRNNGGVCPAGCGAQEQRPRQEKAPGEPVGLLLFLGVAGEEGLIADRLDGLDLVFEEDV